MAKGESKPGSEGKTPPAKEDVKFNLADGREVVIKPCFGYHIEEANKVVDGDSSKMMSALAAQLVTIGGKKCVYEDIRFLPGKDYVKIMSHLSKEFGDF